MFKGKTFSYFFPISVRKTTAQPVFRTDFSSLYNRGPDSGPNYTYSLHPYTYLPSSLVHATFLTYVLYWSHWGQLWIPLSIILGYSPDSVKQKSEHIHSVFSVEHNSSQHSYSICYTIEATVKNSAVIYSCNP